MLSQGWVESDSVELSGVVPRRSMWSSDGRGIQGEGHRTLLPRQKQERGFSLSVCLSFAVSLLLSFIYIFFISSFLKTALAAFVIYVFCLVTVLWF